MTMPLTQKVTTELGRIVRYSVTGVCAALTYMLVAFAIGSTNLVGHMAATVIGYFASVVISYLGHLYFSFRVEPDHRAYIPRFVATVAVVFVMTIGLTWLLTDFWSYSYPVAIVAVTALIPAISYACTRFWVFLPGLKG